MISFFNKSLVHMLFGITGCLSLLVTQKADAETFFKPVMQLQPKIPGNSFLGDGFGQSVWIHGEHAFVAAPFTTVNGATDAGAIYVYKRKGSHWINTQIITTGGRGDSLGFLSVESQGKWLLFSGIGTPLGSEPKDRTGSVLAYYLNDKNGKWEFVQSLDRSNRSLANLTPEGPRVFPPSNRENGAQFGFSLSLDINKKELFVGAPDQGFFTNQSNPIVNAGQVFVFRLQEEKKRWVLAQRISSPDGATANNHFGEMVRVKGNVAFIAATSIIPDPVNLTSFSNGAVYFYKRVSDDQWKFVQKVVGDQVGQTLATLPLGTTLLGDSYGAVLASDHDWLIVGAPLETQNTSAILRGAAYFYKINRGENPSLQFYQKIFSDDLAAHYTTGFGIAVRKGLALICDPTHTGRGGVPLQGGILVFKFIKGIWTQTGTIFSPVRAAYSFFGTSVSLKNHYMITGQSSFMGLVYNNFINIPPLSPYPSPFTPTPAGTAFIFKRTS